jgi:hypothetical protein
MPHLACGAIAGEMEMMLAKKGTCISNMKIC